MKRAIFTLLPMAWFCFLSLLELTFCLACRKLQESTTFIA